MSDELKRILERLERYEDINKEQYELDKADHGFDSYKERKLERRSQ